MDSKRRYFIRQSGLLSGAFFLVKPLQAMDSAGQSYLGINNNEINIVHSNDLHNRLESFSFGAKNGYGGMTNIEKSLASKSPNLLLDAGDFLDQSASYGEHKKMISRMNELGYTAATVGNHELGNGVDYFASLVGLMNFSIVNCNYSFDHFYLSGKIKPFTIVKTGRYKIGLTGVGVVTEDIRKQLEAHHPYESANKVAHSLKRDYDCDLVICLSHLGYSNEHGLPNNLEFAEHSESIDLIISGHADTVVRNLKVARNRKKEEVMISHAAPSGLLLKQIVIGFNELGIRNNLSCKNIVPGSPRGASGYEEIKRITA